MIKSSTLQSTKELDYSYQKDFKYKHKNPYHTRLQIFDKFVLRDNEGESLLGNWSTHFENSNPVDAEIGTGYGHFMIEYCQQNPERNFVGLDYRFKRSFNLAKKLSSLSTHNFRYLRAKGERIQFLFSANELDRIFYFFPDPWPKNRHKKKRLFQLPFLQSCHHTLRPGGKLYIKTDHDEYFLWMMDIFSSYQEVHDGKVLSLKVKTNDLYKEEKDTEFLPNYQTKFEKIFRKQKKNINAAIIECNTAN